MKENETFPIARASANFMCGCDDDSPIVLSMVTIPNDKGAALFEVLAHCPKCNVREVFCFRERFKNDNK